MTDILTDPGDQLKGTKIYAQFRKKTPPNNPKEIRNKDGSLDGFSYTLITSVFCVIEKSYKSKP